IQIPVYLATAYPPFCRRLSSAAAAFTSSIQLEISATVIFTQKDIGVYVALARRKLSLRHHLHGLFNNPYLLKNCALHW
ncbi:MAG: hypothetical protein OSJ64_06925, partial [Firmicutes bacterium]|nr:hypothetical protein [Bacillota bacterium]